MNSYRAELHIHTVLSPCAEVEMIPPLIIESALDKGINLIAITDHNASANVIAVQQAAEGTALTVLPGMELQTSEEVHCLCLFDHLEQLDNFQVQVSTSLPKIKNQPEHFGEQFIVDKTGDFLKREEKLLIVSSSISLNKAYNLVAALGGILIPAHIDRKAFGLIENLGFVPTDIPIEVLEISRNLTPAQAFSKFPQINGYSLIRSGDVHMLDQFLGANYFEMEHPSIAEIRMAIRRFGGRSLSVV